MSPRIGSNRTTSALLLLALLAACRPAAEPGPRLATREDGALLPGLLSTGWESGLGTWTAATTSGTCTWHVVTNPHLLQVASDISPFAVTLPDDGHHLPARSGTNVVWFGEDTTGTFIGTPYTVAANDGGTSTQVQTGTLTSPAVSFAGATRAVIEFDAWWEIEGVAGQAFDIMSVQVSTDGTNFTEVGKLNPTFSTGAPSQTGYTAGGSSAPPEWRHYAFDVSSYAGQTVYVRFAFTSGDMAYNGFRGWTIDNVDVGAGDAYPAPTLTGVTPAIGAADAIVSVTGTNFLQGATFLVGSTALQAGDIVQFGTSELIFKVPAALADGTYDVVVQNPDGQSATLPGAFTKTSTPSPSIAAVSPSTGTVGVATPVTISGASFVLGSTVTVGPYTATGVDVVSAASITATFPPMPAGNYNVTVTSPNGQSGTLFTAFSIAPVVDTSTITVTAPNGGESWLAGSPHVITWTHTGVTTVALDLYKDGSFDRALATGLAAGDGSFAWTVPVDASGGGYTVRASNQLGSSFDYSDGPFTVVTGPPSWTVTATATGGGTLGCTSPVLDGQPSTCTIGGAGVELVALTDNGVDVLAAVSGGVYTIASVTADHTVVATFVAVVCGDGVRNGAEACDDSNATPADGCSADCQVEPGYGCPATGACAPICGDGVLTATEGCDDGDLEGGDGCSAACTLEAGATCFFDTPNLVVNGSFDADGAGWTSEYGWADPSGTNVLVPEGLWSVSGDPHTHLHFQIPVGFVDAEGSASNKAAYFNGAATALSALAQPVTLEAGKSYVASAYVANWTTPPNPRLSISIGGQLLSRDLEVSTQAWVRVGGTFFAAATGPTTLAVVDSVTAGSGNDFAVDAVSLREAAPQTCVVTCARDADCAGVGAGAWCDTTGIGHAPYCRPPLPAGDPMPAIPNRDPADPPLDGTCTPESASAVCADGRCNAAADTCAANGGACALNAQCVSNVCTALACVPQWTVTFATDGTAGATITGATAQAVLDGGDTSAVTAVAPQDHNFWRWTGTGGFVTTSANPLVVTAVSSDLAVTASFAGVGAVTATQGAAGSATVGAAFSPDLCVEVRDTQGAVVPGAVVHFAAPATGASASVAASVTADGAGVACASAVANTVAGSYAVSATAGAVTATVATLSNTPGAPAALVRLTGDAQHATVNTAFAAALGARVEDQHGNRVPGVLVTLAVPASGATAVPSAASATTDAAGEVSVTATAGTVAGAYQVTATAAGVAAPVTYGLTNDPGAPANLTPVAGATPQAAAVGGNAFANPLAVVVEDGFGNPVPGVEVTFEGPSTGARAILSGTTATTGAAGRAEVTGVTGDVSGGYTVTAAIPGGLTATFSLENTVGPPATLVLVAGGTQAAVVDAAFGAALSVRVDDPYGNPVPGVLVGFAAPATGATAALGATGLTTDAAGLATVTATAGSVAGGYQVTATATGVAAPVVFDLENLPGAPATVTAAPLAATQSAEVGTAYPQALGVTVRDAHGNVVPGVTVTWAAPGTGAAAALSATTAVTAADGTAAVSATANLVAGAYEVTAGVDGATSATFSLTNLAGAPSTIATVSGTPQEAVVDAAYAAPLVVVVRDGHGNPVTDAAITFAAPASGATASLSAASVATGADGRASVSATAGTVAGPFQVTATLDGAATPVQFALTNLPGAPAQVTAGPASSGQSTRVGEPFAAPLVLTVTDAHGNPVPGVAVAFACPATGLTCEVSAEGGVTGADGQVEVDATAGTTPGSYVATGTVTGLPAVEFELTNLVGLPGSIAVVAGGTQTTGVYGAFGAPLAVVVRDAYGNPVPAVAVTFEVVSTADQGAVLSSGTAVTDAAGEASVTATANSARGAYTVRASAPGVATPAAFALTNTAVAAELEVEIALPVFSTVVTEGGVTRITVAVGPEAGGAPPTGTITVTSTRPIGIAPGQAGVTMAGAGVVKALSDGAAVLDVTVKDWRAQDLTIAYTPDAAAALTWDPASVTRALHAREARQDHDDGGCGTGGGGGLALLPLLLLALRGALRPRGAPGTARSGAPRRT